MTTSAPVPALDRDLIARLRFDGTRWFAAFEQAADRTAAEALRGLRLMVDTADRDADGPEDAGGENDAWYAHELIGLRAVRALRRPPAAAGRSRPDPRRARRTAPSGARPAPRG